MQYRQSAQMATERAAGSPRQAATAPTLTSSVPLGAAIVAAVLLFWALAALAQTGPLLAGQVVLTVGDVYVVRANGREAPLSRGDAVYRGDTVSTERNARVQVLFTDGSRMSIRPGSDVDLSDYAYDPQVADNNRFRMRLRRGGFRTETGSIGRLNRAGYRIDMPMSTIGVRGTVFGAGVVDEGDAVGTSQGTVDQSSGGGSLQTGPDSDFLYSVVTDPDLPPEGRSSPPGDFGEIMNLDLPTGGDAAGVGGLAATTGGEPDDDAAGETEAADDAGTTEASEDEAASGPEVADEGAAGDDDGSAGGGAPAPGAGDEGSGEGTGSGDQGPQVADSGASDAGAPGSAGAGGPGDIDLGSDGDAGGQGDGGVAIGGSGDGAIEVPQFNSVEDPDAGAEPLFQFGNRCL